MKLLKGLGCCSTRKSQISHEWVPHEEYFRREMGQMLQLQREEAIRAHKKRLAQAEKRIAELDRLFLKIYEDNTESRSQEAAR